MLKDNYNYNLHTELTGSIRSQNSSIFYIINDNVFFAYHCHRNSQILSNIAANICRIACNRNDTCGNGIGRESVSEHTIARWRRRSLRFTRDHSSGSVIDRYKDQIPGNLPPGMMLEEADGNHIVLDLGNGRYGLYDHLKPGSITVKEGDTVKRGQVLGLVGNTGNTSAPHLHFHVMSSQSTLGSNGLPYVIDKFELIEKATSTEAFDKAESEGVPLEVMRVEKPGIHKN